MSTNPEASTITLPANSSPFIPNAVALITTESDTADCQGTTTAGRSMAAVRARAA
jgi:hypothetical protein